MDNEMFDRNYLLFFFTHRTESYRNLSNWKTRKLRFLTTTTTSMNFNTLRIRNNHFRLTSINRYFFTNNTRFASAISRFGDRLSVYSNETSICSNKIQLYFVFTSTQLLSFSVNRLFFFFQLIR